MKKQLPTLALFGILICLSSCGSSDQNISGNGLYDPGYGPFDSKGNYLEHEADRPAKQKRRPSRQSRGQIAQTNSKPKKEQVRTITPQIAKAEKVYSPPTVYKPLPKPTTTYQKPKPKPVATVKPKPKPTIKAAPKLRYHIVKKGDTLYAISRKYSTSVAKIQQTNKVRGTTIRIGQTLKIPR